MKKYVIFFMLFTSLTAFANDKQTLSQRLNKLDHFYAKFSQSVAESTGNKIQQGEGELWLKKPSYFNFVMNEPDKTVIVSDSRNLWFYSPEVDQVTIMSLTQAVDNKLLLLLTDSRNAVLDDYNVYRTNNRFKLTPKNLLQQQFEIGILPTGMLTDFAIIETDGQKNAYVLSHQTQKTFSSDKFKFAIPKNVTIDDQRE